MPVSRSQRKISSLDPVAVQVADDRLVVAGRQREALLVASSARFHHETACRQAAFRSHNTWVSSFGAITRRRAPVRHVAVGAADREVEVDVVVVADAALAHRVPRRDAAVAVAVPAAVVEQDLLDAELRALALTLPLASGASSQLTIDRPRVRL